MAWDAVRQSIAASVLANHGILTKAAFDQAVSVAKAGESFIDWAEQMALFNPSSYLKTDRRLTSVNITATQEALDAARALAKDLHYSLKVFSKIAIAPATPAAPTDPADTGTLQPADPLGQMRKELDALLAKGNDLGAYDTWKVKTTGSDLTFCTKASGNTFPALVLDSPTWTDPAPRKLVAENEATFREITTAQQLKDWITGLADPNTGLCKDYLLACDIRFTCNNERYGIESMRQKNFLAEIRTRLADTKMTPAERDNCGVFLTRAREDMVSGQLFELDVGTHHNYWPYSDNYASQLATQLEQTDPASAGYKQIKNRLEDIYRWKTVFSYSRSIDEKNFESSVGGALVYSPRYGITPGHRISLAKDATTYEPRYELLTIAKANLPAEHAALAGLPVYRDGSVLRFDHLGDPSMYEKADPKLVQLAMLANKWAGKEVPSALVDGKLISARPLIGDDLEHLTIRKLRPGEQIRSGISVDWDGNGQINVAMIIISWWGHCHNESPLNAMGINPQKGVSLYRADRGVPAQHALKEYSHEDAWDVAGNFAASNEGGFETLTGRPSDLNRPRLVGDRNNGNHKLQLVGTGEKDLVTIKAEAKSTGGDDWFYNETNAAMKLYRRNLPDTEGTYGSFHPNPDLALRDSRTGDLVSLKVGANIAAFDVTYLSLNEQGEPYEANERITLDPANDTFIKLAEETIRRTGPSGGQVKEHWYNPKTKMYHSVTQQVAQDGTSKGWKRTEVSRTPDVAVVDCISTQETPYDSVTPLHELLMEKIGYGRTIDTSSGKMVWNYPLKSEKLTVLNDTLKNEIDPKKPDEGEKPFLYTTYQYDYDTEGGPSATVIYTIKRNMKGEAKDDMAETEMYDFTFVHEHWVCAPIAVDKYGQTVYNVRALNAGYLVKESSDGRPDLSAVLRDLWLRQATLLYAAITDKTAPEQAYVFEATDGRLLSYPDKPSFMAAVSADQALRAEESKRAAHPTALVA